MIDFIFIILPLVAIGIAMIFFTNNIKKKNKEKKSSQDDNFNEEEYEEISEGNYIAMGICFGAAIGSIFINTFGVLSISYGVCFGVIIGIILSMNVSKK